MTTKLRIKKRKNDFVTVLLMFSTTIIHPPIHKTDHNKKELKINLKKKLAAN